MTEPTMPPKDRRWPRRVYDHGVDPDPRFTFANERTFLAWIRTGLGFLTAGVAIAALADLNADVTVTAHVAAVILIVCGVLCAVGGLLRWARAERAMRLNQSLPSSLQLALLTVGLVLVALIAFLVVGQE